LTVDSIAAGTAHGADPAGSQESAAASDQQTADLEFVLAGIVGVVSLTEARAAALIGVFISVTTIPAAAYTGVSIAYANWAEAHGSALQLLLNVTALIAIGHWAYASSGSSGLANHTQRGKPRRLQTDNASARTEPISRTPSRD
jgi:hypothetical protein